MQIDSFKVSEYVITDNSLSLSVSLLLVKAASMMLLSLSFTWKVLAPYSGTLAVLGTVL